MFEGDKIMMRWKLWRPKHDQDVPPSYAFHRAFGWVVLQEYSEQERIIVKGDTVTRTHWIDVPLYIESKE